MPKRPGPLKIHMSFEDTLKHVLSVGPMPKDDRKSTPKARKKPVRKKR